MSACSLLRRSWQRLRGLSVALPLVVVLAACAPALIAPYDEVTDQTVSALQRRTEAHLLALEDAQGTPACTYAQHRQFYADARIETSALAVRSAAIPGNALTSEQVLLLLDSLEQLRQLHQIACLTTAQIAILRTQFNSSFTAILKLELAKRRTR